VTTPFLRLNFIEQTLLRRSSLTEVGCGLECQSYQERTVSMNQSRIVWTLAEPYSRVACPPLLGVECRSWPPPHLPCQPHAGEHEAQLVPVFVDV
jgi:hypothetical protein